MVDLSRLSFSAHMMCPNYDSFCFRISASVVHGDLISTNTDLFVLLQVHGMLNICLQHHISKLSIFFLSFFFTVHDSHLCIETENTRTFTSLVLVCDLLSTILVSLVVPEPKNNILFYNSLHSSHSPLTPRRAPPTPHPAR